MRKGKKSVIFLGVLFLFLVMTASTCYAASTVTISQLIEDTANYENKIVTIEGEVIGEALERGEFAWINLNDQTGAIGVWLKRSDTEQLLYYGDYGHRGDQVKISGRFSRACTEHGGDFDIHADQMNVVRKGWVVSEKISSQKIMLTLLLLLLTGVLWAVYKRTQKKAKTTVS
ncbi:MAG: hypothetical protein LLG09_04135 [Negativicutes bacterium]|nr:hypothetical protein [Negativicutes bacterium]